MDSNNPYEILFEETTDFNDYTNFDDYKQIIWTDNSCYFSVSMWFLWTIIPFRTYISNYNGEKEGLVEIKKLFEKFESYSEKVEIKVEYEKIFNYYLETSENSFGSQQDASELITKIIYSVDNIELKKKILPYLNAKIRCDGSSQYINLTKNQEIFINPNQYFETNSEDVNIDSCKKDENKTNAKIESNYTLDVLNEYFLVNFFMESEMSFDEIKNKDYNGQNYTIKSIISYIGDEEGKYGHYKCYIFNDDDDGEKMNVFVLDDFKTSNDEGKMPYDADLNQIIINSMVLYKKTSKNIPSQKPVRTVGEILKSNEINDDEYFIHDIDFGEKIHKIIIKYPNNITEKLKDLMKSIINQYVKKNIFDEKKKEFFKNNDEFYPELLTLLTKDYLKFLSDDSKLISNLEVEENFKKVSNECYLEYKNYIDNYLKWGLRIDNSIEDINKRKFLMNFTNLIIEPNGILDIYIPKNSKTRTKGLKNTYFKEKYILPDKRKTKIDSKDNYSKYERNEISFLIWNKNQNEISNENIMIYYDYNLLINWLIKSFNKFFLNDYYPITSNLNYLAKNKLEPIKSNQFNNLNRYLQILKNNKLFHEEIKQIQNLRETQNIFYQKWKNFLEFFSTFLNYYYDDFYFGKLHNSLPLSHCIKNLLISSDQNSENFVYIFIYCLLSKLNSENLKYYIDYNENLKYNKEMITIKISSIKNKFYDYIKYILKLNSSDTKCDLESKQFDYIKNYCNNYYNKQVKFYGILNLSFSPNFNQDDIEIFYNYIIHFVMSNTFFHLCEKINIKLEDEKIKNTINKFISQQYKKIYESKSIDMYNINIGQSLVDLFECLKIETEDTNLDDLIGNMKKIINDKKFKSKLFLNPLKFNNNESCISIPNFNLDNIKFDNVKGFYMNMIDEVYKPKSYSETLTTLGRVLQPEIEMEPKMEPEKEEGIEQKELKKWEILELKYKRDDLNANEIFSIIVDGEYNKVVIDCLKNVINLLNERVFFDLINIIDLNKLGNFTSIVKEKIISLVDYLQKDYDDEPTKFNCDDDYELSQKMENRILDEMEDNDIYKFVNDCERDGMYYNVKISYEFFYPVKKSYKTIGQCVFNLINKNKKSFLEIIYDDVINKNIAKNRNITDEQLKDITRNEFMNYVNKELNRVLYRYKKNNTYYLEYDDFYFKLLNDLIDNIIWSIEDDYINKTIQLEQIKSMKQTEKIEQTKQTKSELGSKTFSEVVKEIVRQNKMMVRIKNTNIDIIVNLDIDYQNESKENVADKEKLFCSIKSYLEECDEITKISKYYQPIQIENGIYDLIDYYKNNIIPINDKTFCIDFTASLICLLIRQITSNGYEINGIKIKSEYFNIWINEYINLGTIFANYIQWDKIKIKKENLQDTIDYLSIFYLNDLDKLKVFESIDGIMDKIYNESERYLYVKKCLNQYYKTKMYNDIFKKKYSVKQLQFIDNEIINLFMKYDNINLKKYKVNINVLDLMKQEKDNKCPNHNDFTNIINSIEINKKSKLNKIK